jgi:protein phosphatase
MGAHVAGERASKIAAEQVPLIYEKNAQRSPPLALLRGLEQANTEINLRGRRQPEYLGMGTTCTTLVLVPRGVLVGHVGDSRAYRLRGTTLDQLTRDHSAVWELESQGGLTREQAERTVGKNVITRSMGPHARVEVDIEGPHPVEQGDVFLLCSDGLSGQVADEEIGLFLKELPPRDACAALVGLTLVTATAAALSILGSIQLLGAGKSAVLEISYPLFVALFSVFLFQGQLQLPVVIGGAFIFIGAAIIVLAG